MTKQDFLELLARKIVLLDGATGTELAKLGLPHGVCPEAWILQHPEAIETVQLNYEQAGSDIVYTPTFGCNRYKLMNFSLEKNVVEMNRRLARISRHALKHARVFGDIAPTGQFVEPFGDNPIPFEDIVNAYKEQVLGLLEGGVEGFAVETMMDIQEARAALIAIRELCDLPVIVTMTFDESMRTLTGNTPVSALVTLQALGATAVGCNCSTGPAQMAETIRAMKPYARVPLVAKPNAGMPRLADGETVFDLGPEEFANQLQTIVDAGASIVGGCCGTSPAHIAAVAKTLPKQVPPKVGSTKSCLSAARSFLEISREQPFAIIGERINPTGKKKLQGELKEGRLNLVSQYAREQAQAGAKILDVNVGMPNIDETAMMHRAVALLSNESELPLCLDTTKPEVAEAALRLYPGRALFNSISAESGRLNDVLPIAAKYGAMLVILPLDDAGIPENVEKRAAIAQDIMAKAAQYGCQKQDFVLDGLVMTVSANPQAALDTLSLIEWGAQQGLNTVCGLSNVSFGLPRRDLINRAFLSMAIARGLNLAIANPMLPDIVEAVSTGDVLTGRDPQAMSFIRVYANTAPATVAVPAQTTTAAPQAAVAPAESPAEGLKQAVINADESQALALLDMCLKQNIPPQELVDNVLIPAITVVGEKFEKKEFFLPQLLGAAKTMRRAMGVLEPLLKTQTSSDKPGVPFILATVKGDIHDIGKNIVALMLKNYNFDVVDLGRDVPADTILDAAVSHHAKLVGLSALMTTTMVEMKTVIDAARARGLDDLIFIVGGAVVTEDYAQSLGAHYAKDAMATVRLAQQFGNL